MADYVLSAKGTYDGSNFDRGVKSNEGSLDHFKSKCSAVSVAVGNVLANMAAKGFQAITSHMDAAIARVDKLNQFPKVMKNLGYSADDASASIKKMSDGIEGLPTSLDEIVGNTQALALSLGDLGRATDVAIALNDGFLTFGASSAEVTNAITQLNQMVTAGTYDMQSWNSINQAAPGFLDTVATSMLGAGKKASDLREALNGGKVSSEDFLNAIIDLDRNGADGVTAFSQSAKDAVGGIGTSMKNVGTAITKNLANIIDAVNGAGAISSFFDSVKGAVNAAGKAVLPAATTFGQFLAAVQQGQPLLQAFGKALDMQAQFTWLESFLQGCEGLFRSAESPARGFYLVMANVRTALTTFSDSGQLQGAVDSIKAAFESLPEPVRNAVATVASNVQSMASAVSNTFALFEPVISAAWGALQEFASKAAQAAGSLTSFDSFFEGIQEVLGSTAAKATAFGAVFVAVLANFSGPLTVAVTAVAGLAGKLGGLAGIAGTVGSAFAAIGSKVNVLQSAITLCGGGLSGLARVLTGGVASALRGVGGAVAAVASPVGIAVVAIAALAAGFAYMMATNSGFRDSIISLVGSIGSSLAPVLVTVGTALANLASSVLPMIMGIIQEVAPVLGQIVQVALELVAALAPVVTMLISQLMPVVTTVITSIVAFVQAAMPTIVGLINMALGVIQAVIPVVASIASVVGSVVGAVVGAVGMVVNIVMTVATAVMGFVSTIVSALANLSTTITAVFGAIAAFLSGAVAVIVSVVSNAFSTVFNVVSTVCNDVSSIVSGFVGAVSGLFEAVASNIISAVAYAHAQVSAAFEAIVTAVSGAVEGVLSTVSALPGDILSAIGDLSDLLYQKGCDVISGFVNGIQSMVGNALSAVQGLAGDITGAISDALKIGSPSKVFRKIGEYTVKGLAIGIEVNDDAQRAVESLTSGMTSAANLSLSGFGQRLRPLASSSGFAVGYAMPQSAAPSLRTSSPTTDGSGFVTNNYYSMGDFNMDSGAIDKEQFMREFVALLFKWGVLANT